MGGEGGTTDFGGTEQRRTLERECKHTSLSPHLFSPTSFPPTSRCALVLRDAIAPHLLRRRKADVRAQLPKKTEQVGVGV